ncbi:DUF547 domain-containing protein [Hoeflea sp. TYP-13]|uniref:DUF547 domain-containing protein n=1 Tax=Hoeflea sp. TYP-13 TaxID=3230023 RepID=UPI0034C65552
MTGISRRQLLTGTTTITAVFICGISPVTAAGPIGKFRPGGNGGIGHSAFDAILRAYVRRDANGYNTIDYRGLKAAGHGALKSYLGTLQNAKPSTFSANEAHAYWINLYNAATLDVVTDHYPVTSIKKINLGGGGLFGSGPWSRRFLSVEGTALSLDDIEHRIVRPIFSDPMSHYGLNCASYSCPNLVTSAYTGSNLDGLLQRNARDYVNHERGVSVRSGRITSSKIYSWYAADFGGKPRLKQHWGAFAAPQHGAAIRAASLGRFVYDWSLNDAA